MVPVTTPPECLRFADRDQEPARTHNLAANRCPTSSTWAKRNAGCGQAQIGIQPSNQSSVSDRRSQSRELSAISRNVKCRAEVEPFDRKRP